ncbi:MAG: hypothetical protein WCW26_03930 [Candidatus Buchananbacteria bacterium]
MKEEAARRRVEKPEIDLKKLNESLAILDSVAANPNVYELPKGKDYSPYKEAAKGFIQASQEGIPEAKSRDDLTRIANEILNAASIMEL